MGRALLAHAGEARRRELTFLADPDVMSGGRLILPR